jgi:hypothetical protein
VQPYADLKVAFLEQRQFPHLARSRLRLEIFDKKECRAVNGSTVPRFWWAEAPRWARFWKQ